MGQRGAREVLLVAVEPGAAGVAQVNALLPDALAGRGPALGIAPAGTEAHAVRARTIVTRAPVDTDIAVVLGTSGSTGNAHGVMLDSAALLASARSTHDRLGGPGSWLLALPVTGIAGLQVLIRSLLAQVDPVVLASVGGAAPFEPRAFADAAWRLDPSLPGYTALVPAQAALLLDDPDGLAALQGFDAVLLGGARTAPHLLARLEAAHIAVVTTYGMTETCGGAFYDGIPLDGVTASLLDVDPTGLGRIVITGPTIARGYLADDEATAEAFVSGGHVTNDVGRLNGTRLTIEGRIDDIVQVGGTNVAVSAIEDLLATIVSEACVLATIDEAWGQRLTAYIVPRSDDGQRGDDNESLAALVLEHLGRAAVPRTWVRLGAIPYLPTGKPDRAALRDLAAT
ncbi:MAG: AMP-binding protein [Actinobacteria bacterium]|uniref:Unannotated protein n=1 Tax=freshwater metagenome TaxID=449393 RepID=A0A6J7QK18_9ZZZZ|nr:AMP-binding protein [Actinomycetota bacterium]